MKALITALSVALLFAFGSCSGEAAMSKEGLAKTITESISGALTKLEGVKDKAGAEAAKKAVDPMIEKASGALKSLKALPSIDLKALLGDKLAPLTEKVTKIAGSFAGKPDVGAILTPVLDKIKGMINLK